MYESDPWVLAGLAVVVVAVKVHEWARDRWGPTEKEREQAALREQYVSGEIGIETYEKRLEAMMDPRNDEIQAVVDDVSGIGPVTSREIALAFESVGELRRADRADLLDVPGVGPERADAILDRVQ